MTTNDKKNFTASLLEKAARGSAKVAVNSRCMYCLHQPKQPRRYLLIHAKNMLLNDVPLLIHEIRQLNYKDVSDLCLRQPPRDL